MVKAQVPVLPVVTDRTGGEPGVTVAIAAGPNSMRRRRYEILLPAAFNDGRLIAEDCPSCLPTSIAEIVDTFGAVTFRPDKVMGSWMFGGRRYDDTLSVVGVDVDDTPEHRAWIEHLKQHLLERFNQLEIYVTSYPIDVH